MVRIPTSISNATMTTSNNNLTIGNESPSGNGTIEGSGISLSINTWVLLLIFNLVVEFFQTL
jgi:hypothetical protein